MAEGLMLAYEKGYFNNVLLGVTEPVKAYYSGVLYLLYAELMKHYRLLIKKAGNSRPPPEKVVFISF